MKVILESTQKTVFINGVPARIWEGETASGIKVHCYITLVSVAENEPNTQEFEQELERHAPPSVEMEAIPLRLII